MPVINANSMENHTCSGGAFSYSAASLDGLTANEYTLFTLALDRSGSVAAFRSDLEACVREIFAALREDDRAEFIQARVLLFGTDVRELHGFRPLAQCPESDYHDFLSCDGMTALFEAACDGVEGMGDFAAKLLDRDYPSNGVLYVVTDGCDNMGPRRGLTTTSIKDALTRAVREERLESMLSVLVGVNVSDPGVKGTLAQVEVDGGFDQFLPIAGATKEDFKKLGRHASASVSSQSKQLGSGGPSKPLSF